MQNCLHVCVCVCVCVCVWVCGCVGVWVCVIAISTGSVDSLLCLRPDGTSCPKFVCPNTTVIYSCNLPPLNSQLGYIKWNFSTILGNCSAGYIALLPAHHYSRMFRTNQNLWLVYWIYLHALYHDIIGSNDHSRPQWNNYSMFEH